MEYKKPIAEIKMFSVQDFLTDSSVDELPGNPDDDHEVFPDAFSEAFNNVFDFDSLGL